MGIRDMQRKIRMLKADIEEAEAAEDLWPCSPNEKRIAYFRELLEYYEADLEMMREVGREHDTSRRGAPAHEASGAGGGQASA